MSTFDFIDVICQCVYGYSSKKTRHVKDLVDIKETMQYIVNLYSPFASIYIFYSCNSASETCYKRVTDICLVSHIPSRLSAHKEQTKLIRPTFH